MGVAPSGREMTNRAIVIHRIVEGEIAEEWSLGTLGSKLRGQRLEQERIERERVEQELQVARSIQHASLPKEVPQLEGWQISPFYKPAREVGGDFYDFHLLSDGRLGVVVGDATGKGVPAALVMSTTCGMLQLAARALDSTSPGEVLAQVNETLFARIPSNMFVTCFYAILDPNSGRFTYANAGHDLPYLWHGGDAEELRARGMPLCIMPEMSYEEKEMVLDAAEGVLFLSDGLVEAHDPKGEMFGVTRLRALVAEHDQERSLADFLLEELYSFTGEGWESKLYNPTNCSRLYRGGCRAECEAIFPQTHVSCQHRIARRRRSRRSCKRRPSCSNERATTGRVQGGSRRSRESLWARSTNTFPTRSR